MVSKCTTRTIIGRYRARTLKNSTFSKSYIYIQTPLYWVLYKIVGVRIYGTVDSNFDNFPLVFRLFGKTLLHPQPGLELDLGMDYQ
jgi:hypothetical protein